MSDRIVADFKCDFLTETMDKNKPVRGRIIMSPDKVVLVSNSERIQIQLSQINDVLVGQVPPGMEKFFNDTITIGYEESGSEVLAIIESNQSEVINKFRDILFRALINNIIVMIRHPSRIGGSVTNEKFQKSAISIDDLSIKFKNVTTIDIVNVVDFEKRNQKIDSKEFPGFMTRHIRNGTAQTTDVALQNSRHLDILGRYVTIVYQELLSEIEDIEISDDEKRVLVSLYSTNKVPDISSLLGVSEEKETTLMQSLSNKGLIKETNNPELTHSGQIVANRNLEDINM